MATELSGDNKAKIRLEGGNELSKKQEKPWSVPPYPPLGMPLNPLGVIVTDPMGGYTGRPIDPEETPVQDMDDL